MNCFDVFFLLCGFAYNLFLFYNVKFYRFAGRALAEYAPDSESFDEFMREMDQEHSSIEECLDEYREIFRNIKF